MNYKNVDSFIWIQDLSLPFFGDRNIQSKRNLGIVIMIIIMPLVLLVKMILADNDDEEDDDDEGAAAHLHSATPEENPPCSNSNFRITGQRHS